MIGKHRTCTGAEEIGVPDPDHGHKNREVSLERRLPKMLVHRLSTSEQALEAIHAN